MSDDEREPTQKTPKGYEIPIPKKDDVLKVLRKASRPLDASEELAGGDLEPARDLGDGRDS